MHLHTCLFFLSLASIIVFISNFQKPTIENVTKLTHTTDGDNVVTNADRINFIKTDDGLSATKGKVATKTKDDAIIKDTRNKSKKQKNDMSRPSSPHLPQPKIKRIALLGERHSGTNWITLELKKCFPSLKVTTSLARYKHWFQDEDIINSELNDDDDDDDERHDDSTLVIVMFRNIYDWTEAMRKMPHHAPNHHFLKWRDFVTKPWDMPRSQSDIEWLHNQTTTTTMTTNTATSPSITKKRKCQKDFAYDEINSCIRGTKNDEIFTTLKKSNHDRRTYSAHTPLYELRRDGSGLPYDSILQLRAAKIKNHLSVRDWNTTTTTTPHHRVADVISVRYETLIENGTDGLLRDIEERLLKNEEGVVAAKKRRCEAVPPQPWRLKERRPLRKVYVRWMNRHVDWDAERLIGYEKWDVDGETSSSSSMESSVEERMRVVEEDPVQNEDSLI